MIDENSDTIEAIDEIQNYWNERMLRTTPWFVALNLSDTVFQLNAIRKPFNEKHLIINVIYMIFSLLTFIGLYLSYKNPARRKL